MVSFPGSPLSLPAGAAGHPTATDPPAALSDIPSIAVTGYTLKFVIAIGITPLVYLGRIIMRRCFGLTPLPVGDLK